MAVPAALGLNPTVANSVHKVINDGVGSILPSGIQRAVLDGIFKIGRAQLSESLLNENNPLGASRLAKLRQIFEEGKSLQLQFPAEDLGFRYLEGAVVPDIDSAVSNSTRESPTGHRRDYIPNADPGSRLPHMNVSILSNSLSKETISTLDLISGDKGEFVLFIAPTESSYYLARAAFEVAQAFKVPIRVCVMWSAGTTTTTTEGGVEVASETSLAPWKNYVDIMEVKKRSPASSSYSCSWWEMCKMTESGAILVRPDEHIAWRVKSGIDVGDPIQEMKRVFSVVLGLKSKDV